MARSRRAPKFRPWVEGVAGSIGDPVHRLRFLKAVAPLADIRGERRRRWWPRSIRVLLFLAAIAAVLVSITLLRANARAVTPLPARVTASSGLPKPRQASDVWRVEESGAFEVYSNGLRVDNTFVVSHRPRSYLAFPAGDTGPPVRRSEPAGVVFHSTESQQAPFEAGHNETLKKIGESLLDYLRRRQSYHFLIDRFGRVYRVVAEADAANHAGYSVWADGQWLYVNLNDSFFGVAFEARTGGVDGEPQMTAAQVRSAAMLTEMLRARYRIPPENCVTHAQVSVNPSNMRIGYHVDWASEFPFEDLGLPNRHTAALPSIWAFGFEADEPFRSLAGGGLRAGIDSAGAIFNERAAAAGLRPGVYRKQLEQQYRRKLAVVHSATSDGAH
jgi:hypothetical protein